MLNDKEKKTHNIIQQLTCGDYAKAEEMSRDFIQQFPKDAFGYKVLGTILAQCQRSEESVCVLEEGLDHSADDSQMYYFLAEALKSLGRRDEALLKYETALEINPDYAEAYYNMGAVLQDAGRFEEALSCYRKTAEIKPDFAPVYNNIGAALHEMGRRDEALLNYKKALEIQPDYAEVYYNIGGIFKDKDAFDEALLHYTKALELKPDCVEAYNNIGIIFKDLGQFDEALSSYAKALEIKPDYAEALYNASILDLFHIDDSVLAELNTIIVSKKYLSNEKMHAHFALGNIYNKSKNDQAAFENYMLGHGFRYEINKSKGHPYRHNELLERLALFRQVFTQKFFVDRMDWALSVDTPIFIVGFPRSGTSLVEHILSSHSAVYGAGELKDIEQFVSSFVDLKTIRTHDEFLQLIDNKKILEFSARYLEKINTISNNSRFVTDKMPHNFEHLWFIRLLFKNVTILHCTRSPEDTCLSCYFSKFTEEHEYIDRLKDLAKHYKYYLETMKLWKSVFPAQIHDISYEKLVQDPETEIRNLLSVCHLDFEEQCLEFYKTKRSVNTASATQVREKMYTSSVGKWKRYEEFLGPLLDELHKK